jgi:hypothetical protein
MAVLLPEPDRPVIMIIDSCFTSENHFILAILECWNTGMLDRWIIEKGEVTTECFLIEWTNQYRHKFFNNPISHYSIIPFFLKPGRIADAEIPLLSNSSNIFVKA